MWICVWSSPNADAPNPITKGGDKPNLSILWVFPSPLL